MITVFSQKDAFALDELTITSKHLTEKELLDNAGRSIAQFIVETIEHPFNQKFIVIAGPGNNGGDAIISHYYLNFYGVQSELLLLDEKQKNSWIFNQYSVIAESIEIYSDECSFNSEYWYVDGIFGIGVKRTVEGQYKDGKEEGLHTSWYENGQKAGEEHYKNGKSDGLTTIWYESGKKNIEKYYKNGKEEGLWMEWSEEGKKTYEGHFKEGNEL